MKNYIKNSYVIGMIVVLILIDSYVNGIILKSLQ
jgi:hypothetical protein